MSVVTRIVYINKLDEMVGKHSNTYLRKITMKPGDNTL